MAQIQLATEAEIVGLRRTPPTIQASNYTIAVADEGKLLHVNAVAGTWVYTIPDDASVPFPIGGFVDIYRNGGGANTLTIQAAAGVGLRFRGQNTVAGSFALPYQYSVWRLVKVVANTWLLYDLTGDDDTGWVTVNPAAGFAANNAGLQLRRVGRVVTCRYGFSNTGITTLNTAYTVVAAGGVPAAFVPPAGYYGWAGTSSVQNPARVIIAADGSVTVQPGGTAISSYYRFDPCTWMVD